MAGSTTPPSQKPRKRVSRVQARNRRVMAVLLLAIVIFLFRRGCVACVRSHDKKENQTAAETTTAVTTELISQETTVTTAAPLPNPYSNRNNNRCATIRILDFWRTSVLLLNRSRSNPAKSRTSNWLRSYHADHAVACSRF